MNGIDVLVLRKKAGMTQKEFADSIGVSPIIVSHWECGYRNPGARSIRDIEAFKDDLDNCPR